MSAARRLQAAPCLPRLGLIPSPRGGSDIWGASDQFHFVDVPWVGDGVLIAQVLNLTNTNSAAKAGLMFRQSLANNATNVLLAITPGGGSEFNDRPTTGGSSVSSNTPGLNRASSGSNWFSTGATFSAFSSADGVTWAAVPLAGTADHANHDRIPSMPA